MTSAGSWGGSLPSAPSPRRQEHFDIQQVLGHMQVELQYLKSKAQKGASPGGRLLDVRGEAGPPPSDADLNEALSRLENNLQNIKAHKAKVEAVVRQPQPLVPDPGDVPWKHRKYGQHEYSHGASKPDVGKEDFHSLQRDASEYHHDSFGAGYMNEHHDLMHHSSKAEDFLKPAYSDAPHHGHRVPHLHDLTRVSHYSEHNHSNEDFNKRACAESPELRDWLPHLYGVERRG
jgi:hypothetical protein